MAKVGRPEIGTQAEVIEFLQKELGYRYLGDWKDRSGNGNIEASLLVPWLHARGVEPGLAERAIAKFRRTATISSGQQLFHANQAAYESLRYGVKVEMGPGQPTQTVHLVDWDDPHANDFAVAEEVTVEARNTKRPDLVLYVNGIAFAVLELKRSTVSVSEGIRQHLLNQRQDFIEHFFTTVQLVLAGNESEGLRYGVIETPEKYFLRWKQPAPDSGDPTRPLYRDLAVLCDRSRMLELVHDFIAFDDGVKKICRHNQYEGVTAAQSYIARRQGGIIWHTQGSGKSLTMVWLAKWILEHDPNKRVLVVTDRVELDEQIEGVFMGVGEDIRRTRSGAHLVEVLGSSQVRLACSLIHKFGRASEGDASRFAEELQREVPADFKVKGDLVVFIDECHRTQMGDLHKAMKAILPDATFIGFTGTPLLRQDKLMSRQVFGDYIHTYKFDEAVRDGVVLDLRYKARDIEQRLTSPEKVDAWFEAKTRGLSEVAKGDLKKRWGTLQQVLSAQSRLEKIVADICLDFATIDRLVSGKGNAMLVASSIYEACRFHEMFQSTDLAEHCAVVTSYVPSIADIRNETTAEGQTQARRQFDIYCKMLADHFRIKPEQAMAKVEEFEQQMRERFVKEPARLKLLIVVDKLLTGFDAPPATVLYIDKQMRDHGLFQAICRVNRLDGEDKTHGLVVDYKDLFKSLQKAVGDYTGDALDGFDPEDVAGLLKDRLATARKKLEEVREAIKALCEPVPLPRDQEDYIRYFCRAAAGDDETTLPRRRMALYKLAGRYLRAYADLANEMEEAGYSASQTATIKQEVSHYESVRQTVKLASGDYIDLKQYEPAMRHLLDCYLHADSSRIVHDFDDVTLVDLLVRDGPKAIEKLPETIQKQPKAVAETIEGNMRKVIVDEMSSNPKYFAAMSELLDAILEERRNGAIEYEEFLRKVASLAGRITARDGLEEYPPAIVSDPQRAFYDNLGRDADLAVRLDEAIRSAKEAEFRGNPLKEKKIRIAIARTIGVPVDDERVTEVFEIAKHQNAY